MPVMSKFEKERAKASRLRAEVRDLEDECEKPALTGGRIVARIAKQALGFAGAAIAGSTHDRDWGPVKSHTVLNVVGGLATMGKIVASPDRGLDLATEVPAQIVKGNFALTVRGMRDD